ncbi:MAG: error-prone DNA polymerase [Steroidobacteraceae bacterium]
MSSPGYAELHCVSSFSFLRGASQPQELVERAQQLGYAALAITDECSLAGVVRAHGEAKKQQLKLIIGAEFRLECGTCFVALARNRNGYGRLSSLITRGRRAAGKGSYRLVRADVAELLRDCVLIWLPRADAQPKVTLEAGRWLQERFAGELWLGVELLREANDRRKFAQLVALGAELGIPLLACGDVHMHRRERRQLQDAVTAIRLRKSIADAGWALHPNGERYLREPQRLARLYSPELLAATLQVAQRCEFSLDELRYQYPHEIVPEGETPTSYLRRITEAGVRKHWPQGIASHLRAQIDRELELIEALKYEPFFLTVYDIVQFATREKILHQGRGSAANSIVCYCIGVTAVGPELLTMLVERFISRERDEPPDIDIDFEHERREEVIQYIYGKYGRGRAALAATVISYRPRSALRDLSRAFGFDEVAAARLAGTMEWWDGSRIDRERVRAAGFDPDDARLDAVLRLAQELIGFPRHLSQHVGGFVISEGPLDELVPIENASMPERTVIQWDKDDLEELRLLKVDVLGLGMLTAIRRAFDLVARHEGAPAYTLKSVQREDPAVYEMICRADTVGVFQIESRAQMSMLPRLRPVCYYDLVIEVAIVRPGPIQGDMVHPYLRRRSGEESATYPNDQVKAVLERTRGVPIFQEQVMQLAIVAGGFSPGEADELRRAMAAWKRKGGIERFERKLRDGMRTNGYSAAFAEQIFRQIQGFGEYGFPEAHAASFALLVYVSAWLKHYHPAAFTAALLNSLPMGFYGPAQLIADLRAHGVVVRGVDVQHSHTESSLEQGESGEAILRMGFDRVKSLGAEAAARIVQVRGEGGFSGAQDLGERAQLARRELEALAAAGALNSLDGHRHRAYWDVAGYTTSLPTAPGDQRDEGVPLLRSPGESENIIADYHSLGLTLGRHPIALLRERLAAQRILAASELRALPSGSSVRVAGIVVTRQRPGSAGGVTFLTLEDESGNVNVIVWRSVGETQRKPMVEATLLEVRGQLQRESGVTHVIARRMVDHSRLLGALAPRSRDFH